MRKSNLIITLLLIIGFYFVQHRAVPNLALPPTATTSGSTVQIPFAMHPPTNNQETWVLSRDTANRYYVSVYLNERILHRFEATRTISTDTSGTNYTSVGQILFDGKSYQVTAIHVAPSGTSGYISFHPVNQTANQAAHNTSN